MITERHGGGGWLAQAKTLALVFVACVVIFCLLDRFDFYHVFKYQYSRRDIPNGPYGAAVYAAAYIGCVLTLACLYAHAWRPVRYFAHALTILTVTAYLGFRAVNGYGFTYHEAHLIWMETSFIPSALQFFAGSYLLPLAGSVAAVLLYERLVIPRLSLLRSPLLLLLPLLAIRYHDQMLERTFSKVYQTPLVYRLPMLTYYVYKHRVLYYGKRDEPYLKPAHEAWADHIVLVMDESVRGDLLGVNGSEFDTTPLLSSQPERFCNYGVISALSNVSSSSNIMLQSGLRPDQLPDLQLRALKNPSLFSYLKTAGFAGYLLDVQIYSDKPPNFMSRFDIEDLERHHLVRRLEAGRAEYEMDFAATRIVADIIAKHAQSFSYIIKSGAHFPYTDKAAPSAQRFQPALDIGETTRGTERTLNSYLNALSWTVDEYLVNLIEVLEATGERVLVIYTSDHGQSLLERHKGELHLGFPHATPVDPPVYQAMVPLILFGVGDGVQERVSANCHTALRDRVSGFEIFPSVLVMAGYDSEELRRYYHHTLFDAQAPRDGRVFASGNIFGRGSGYQNELIRNNPSFFLNPFVLPEKVGRKGAAGAE